MRIIDEEYGFSVEQIIRNYFAALPGYMLLKSYKLASDENKKDVLSDRFDKLFSQKTRDTTLNKMLKRIHDNKEELLLVLERPEIPCIQMAVKRIFAIM